MDNIIFFSVYRSNNGYKIEKGTVDGTIKIYNEYFSTFEEAYEYIEAQKLIDYIPRQPLLHTLNKRISH